jgi:hypothetical protein
MQFPPTHTYRPSLALAYLACVAWLALLLTSDPFGRLPLPSYIKNVLGLFTPLCASILILSRTVLFREMSRMRRMINLFGIAFALFVCAIALLLLIALLPFGLPID